MIRKSAIALIVLLSILPLASAEVYHVIGADVSVNGRNAITGMQTVSAGAGGEPVGVAGSVGLNYAESSALAPLPHSDAEYQVLVDMVTQMVLQYLLAPGGLVQSAAQYNNLWVEHFYETHDFPQYQAIPSPNSDVVQYVRAPEYTSQWIPQTGIGGTKAPTSVQQYKGGLRPYGDTVIVTSDSPPIESPTRIIYQTASQYPLGRTSAMGSAYGGASALATAGAWAQQYPSGGASGGQAGNIPGWP